MTASDQDFPARVSTIDGGIDTLANRMLGQWIGNQSYGCKLIVVADRHTVRNDGPLITVEADLFAIGEDPQSIRILVSGVHDKDGHRVVSADIHAPTRLTILQAVAAHAAAADPRSAEMARQIAGLDADQLSNHCHKDLDTLAEGWGPVDRVDVTPAADTFTLDGAVASMEAGLIITFTGGRTVSGDILVTFGDPSDPHSPPSIDVL